ncbi:MAG: hypothetical protein ACXV45_04755 [Halobacteriota archaeon]
MSDQKYCLFCGAANPREAVSCANCGERFRTVSDTRAPSLALSRYKSDEPLQTPHRFKRQYVAYGVAAFLILFVAISAAFPLSSSLGAPSSSLAARPSVAAIQGQAVTAPIEQAPVTPNLASEATGAASVSTLGRSGQDSNNNGVQAIGSTTTEPLALNPLTANGDNAHGARPMEEGYVSSNMFAPCRDTVDTSTQSTSSLTGPEGMNYLGCCTDSQHVTASKIADGSPLFARVSASDDGLLRYVQTLLAQ